MTGPNLCECYGQPDAGIEIWEQSRLRAGDGRSVPWLIENPHVLVGIRPGRNPDGVEEGRRYNPFDYYFPPHKRRQKPKGRQRSESLHLEFASLAHATGAHELLAVDARGGGRRRTYWNGWNCGLLTIAVNRLVRASSSEEIEKVLAFVKRWGLPEAHDTDLPAESRFGDPYIPVKQRLEVVDLDMGSRPAVPYSAQRLLYLACEMRYALTLWGLLIARNPDEESIERVLRILELLPSAETRPPWGYKYWREPRAAIVPRHDISGPKEDALRVLWDVVQVRLRPSRTWPRLIRRGRRPAAEPYWWCPDLLTSMWVMFYVDMTAGHTIAQCRWCGLPYHKKPWRRRVRGKLEEHRFCCAVCRDAWKDAHRPKSSRAVPGKARASSRGRPSDASHLPADRTTHRTSVTDRRNAADDTAKARTTTTAKANGRSDVRRGRSRPDVAI